MMYEMMYKKNGPAGHEKIDALTGPDVSIKGNPHQRPYIGITL